MRKFGKIVAGLGIGGAVLSVASAIFSSKAEEEMIKDAVNEYFEEDDCDDDETGDETENDQD